MASPIKFTVTTPGADRIHYVNEEDVRIILGRLPAELWNRLRAVRFNDHARGPSRLGYVNRGSSEIAICALPPRISLARALRGHTCESYGATRGHKWPALAVRRFMLYNVFLHELGHLQRINERGTSVRLQFAREKMAQEFAIDWCKRLWSEPFNHPDPVHNAPTPEELASFTSEVVGG